MRERSGRGRNDDLDDKNTAYSQEASPYFQDNLKRNQFGGTVGGPVVKDRLFFFLGWQDTIQRSTTPATTTLPTEAMLEGDFQPCLGKGNGTPGNTIILQGPYGTGTAGDGATVP